MQTLTNVVFLYKMFTLPFVVLYASCAPWCTVPCKQLSGHPDLECNKCTVFWNCNPLASDYATCAPIHRAEYDLVVPTQPHREPPLEVVHPSILYDGCANEESLALLATRGFIVLRNMVSPLS